MGTFGTRGKEKVLGSDWMGPQTHLCGVHGALSGTWREEKNVKIEMVFGDLPEGYVAKFGDLRAGAEAMERNEFRDVPIEDLLKRLSAVAPEWADVLARYEAPRSKVIAAIVAMDVLAIGMAEHDHLLRALAGDVTRGEKGADGQ